MQRAYPKYAQSMLSGITASKGHIQAGIWILAQLFSEAPGSSEKTVLYRRSSTGEGNWVKLLI